MHKMTPLDRVLLLLAVGLAAYQVVVGVEGLGTLPVTSYTIGFGVLLVAGLLLILLGFEVLDSPVVVIVSTVIPLSLSLGLVAQHLPGLAPGYSLFAVAGFLGVALARFLAPGKAAVLVLAVVHGVSGLIIFGFPIYLSLRNQASPGFALVGVGGALIGVGGLLLYFLKAGRPLLSRQVILNLFPALLLLTTAAFVAGFAFH